MYEASLSMTTPPSRPHIELLQDEYERNPFPAHVEDRIVAFASEWDLMPSADSEEEIMRWLLIIRSMRNDIARWSLAVNLVG